MNTSAGNSGEVADAAVDTTLSGRYRLVGRLGGGATATVWRAVDLETDAPVAVKLLARWGVAPDLAVRFEREGAILGRVSHPNLVAVRGTGNHDGRPYLVMDLVEGVSLRSMLDDGPLPVDQAVAIAADVAAGLGAAHRAGIVHRDVKPANIVCSNDGRPHLVDFGIARADDLTSVTRADTVLGTAAYLSPEQARGEQSGPATDVYALGCVLYEMLTGRPPFDASSAVALAYRHVHDEPAPATSLRPEVPAAVDALVLRSLAKSPDERYGDGAALEAALRRVGEVDGGATVAMAAVSGDTLVLPPASASPTRTGIHRRRLLVAAGAGAAILALAAAALVDVTGDDDPPARSDTTTTTVATTTTTVATTTSAAPLVDIEIGDDDDDDEDRGKGNGKRGRD